jgi:hypothetical protein
MIKKSSVDKLLYEEPKSITFVLETKHKEYYKIENKKKVVIGKLQKRHMISSSPIFEKTNKQRS